MTRHTRITNRIASRLRNRGAFVVKLHGGPYQMAGLPDLLVICAGATALVEVKAPGDSVKRIQKLCHEQITLAGGVVLVVRSWEEVEERFFVRLIQQEGRTTMLVEGQSDD